MNENECIVEIVGLNKRYGNVIALKDINLSVQQGTIVGLIGPNGAGKTTLIEIMAGLRKPDSGEVRIMGYNILERKPNYFLGVQIQENIVFKGLKVYEVIDLFCAMYGYHVSPKELLSRSSLENKRNSFCNTLSGGQNQLLRLYLSLAGDSPIIVLDEPTTGLDSFNKRLIWGAIQKIKEDGKTVFMSSHYMDEIKVLSDKVVFLENGSVINYGNPEEVIADYLNECDVRIMFDTGVDDITQLPGYCFEKSVISTNNNHDFIFRTRNRNVFLTNISNFAKQNSLNIVDIEFFLDVDCKDGFIKSVNV